MTTRQTVPRTTEVIPGAHVSIVLKVDQPTGRQVQGTVRDVLTRGDHHRGIKVRLTDGRIGRVQGMVSGNLDRDISSSDGTASGSSRSPENQFTASAGGPPPPERRGQHPRYRDVRLDEHLDVAPQQIDLGAYIVPNKRKGKGKKGSKVRQPEDSVNSDDGLASNSSSAVADMASANIASANITCPVCNSFEGDEAAVAHHVAEHFE